MYPNVGYYIPNVVLTSNEGCSYTIKADTVFVDSVKAKLTIFNNSVCQVGTVNTIVFSNVSQAPAFSGIVYSYCNFGDGGSDNTNQPTFSHSYTNPGVYDILFAVRSKYGCVDTLRIEDAVLVNSSPSVNIQGADTFCLKPGTMINYTGNVNSPDTIASYKWTIGVDSVGNTPNLSVNYRKPGSHQLKLTVTTIKGCVAEQTKIIIIDSVLADFNLSLTQSCGPANVVFQNNSIAGTNILYTNWFFGDGSTGTMLQPNHAYNLTGVYDVKLLVESGLGCRDSLIKIQAVTIDSIPKLTITSDSLQCKPGTYTFSSNVLSLDSIQLYEWRLNGTLVAVSPNLQYNFSPGNYTVSLKITTIKGCQDFVSKNFIVDSVKAAFNFVPPNICGDTATIRFTNLSFSAFNNAVYNWSFGDGQTSIQASPDHFYGQAGIYDVTLKITSINGCTDSILRPQAITVYPKPIVATIVPAVACAKDSLVFIASVASADSVISKTWRINNIVVGNKDSLQYVIPNSGNYTVSFNILTKYGCNITVTKNLVINPLPVPNAGPSTTICLGSSIQLNAGDGVLYQWTPAATLSNASVANPVATPLAGTKYHVLVTNVFGCKQQDSVLINTDGKVQMQVSNDAIICAGFSTQLNATGNTGNYVWSPVAGLSNAQIANPVATPLTTTQYMVVGISPNVCKNDTSFVTVQVVPNPVISAGPDKTVLAGVPTVLNTTASPFVTGYQWTPSVNLSCTNCSTPTFLPNTNTEFTVTASTPYGCKSSDTIQIFVLCNKGAFYVPNAFTPNNDGKNDRFEIKGFGITKVNRFAVYDRYGHIVFERKQFKPGFNINDSWDGNVKGVAVSTATTFVYVAEVECLGGEVFMLKGTVVVVK
jgi:gliding motility-associated-like protein